MEGDNLNAQDKTSLISQGQKDKRKNVEII